MILILDKTELRPWVLKQIHSHTRSLARAPMSAPKPSMTTQYFRIYSLNTWKENQLLGLSDHESILLSSFMKNHAKPLAAHSLIWAKYVVLCGLLTSKFTFWKLNLQFNSVKRWDLKGDRPWGLYPHQWIYVITKKANHHIQKMSSWWKDGFSFLSPSLLPSLPIPLSFSLCMILSTTYNTASMPSSNVLSEASDFPVSRIMSNKCLFVIY